MNTNIKGITFEKDANGHNFVRIDMERYAQQLQPLLEKLGVSQKPNDWDEGLTSEEFLAETKKILRKKFDERNKIS